MIFEEHANLKYNYGNRHFWAEGYYVSTVGLNKNTIKRYIQNQGLEDKVKDQRARKNIKTRLQIRKGDKGNWQTKKATNW